MATNKDDGPETIHLTFEGRPVSAPAGATVAAALVAANIVDFGSRSSSGAPRGPFCMMGECFDCMVEIDGIANRQACLESAKEGQDVRRMPARFVVMAHGEVDG